LEETVGVVVEANGNLVVTDRINGIIRVDPATGGQTLLLAATASNDFFGIARDADGNFIVADSGLNTDKPALVSPGIPGRIIRVDKTTGVQTVIAQGGNIVHPYGVAFDPLDMSIVVSDMSSFNGLGAIIRIPSVGPQQVVWGPAVGSPQVLQSGPFNCPMGITVENTENILATVFSYFAYGCSNPGIFRVNLMNNSQATVSANPPVGWGLPFGITTEETNNILVVDEGLKGIYRLDPTGSFTGQTPLSGRDQPATPNFLVSPVGITVPKFQPTANIAQPPTVSIAGAPASSPEGTAISLTSTATGTGPFTYSWTVTRNGNPFTSGSAASLNFTPNDNGAYSITLNVTGTSGTGTANASITVTNVAPTVTMMGIPVSSSEGTAITLTSMVSDPSSADTAAGFLYSWAVTKNGNAFASGSGTGLNFTPDDNGTYAVTLTVADKDGGTGMASAMIIVVNVPPVITGVTGPIGPLINGTPVTIKANFTDAGSADTHTPPNGGCVFTWDDGTTSAGLVSETNGSGSCQATHTYTNAGVYDVGVTVTDDDGASVASGFQFVVVFDPTDGYVNGSGSIMSVAGSYVPSPKLDGKARFGFHVRYSKGAMVPSGANTFKFRIADLSFQSTGFQWLVISGANAQFKGSGTVNGAGSYTFLITVVDGDQVGGGGIDKYRFKLVDNSTGQVVYDNVMGTSDDPDLANPQQITSGKVVIFLNAPPVISSLSFSSNAINEGDPITLTGSFTDPDVQSHTVTINWGDGTAGTKVSFSAGTSGNFSATHKYKDNNPYSTPRDTFTIEVTVADGFGATDNGTTTITVANLPTQIGTVTKPSAAVLLGTAVGTTTIPIKVNFTDPGVLDKHTCAYDWGNGQTSTGSVTENNGSGFCIPSQPYTYPLNGTYKVTITVTDIKDSDTATYSFLLVINAPPVLTSFGLTCGTATCSTSTINENDQVTFSGTFTDADDNPTATNIHKVMINWGDGTPNTIFNLEKGAAPTFSATHRYLDNNLSSTLNCPTPTAPNVNCITVTVSDNVGGIVTDSGTKITVNNVAPVITGGLGPNATLPLWIDFTDKGTLDTHKCVLTWGDWQTSPGAVHEGNGLGNCTASHTYTSSGTYTIGITITDNDGGSVSANFPLVVR
jgi:hypothetical protein